jgi:hypothetical protein
MSDKLSEDKLHELLPCLGKMAELISVGNELDWQILANITSETGIYGEEWALIELEIWGKILFQCWDKSNTKDTIVGELRNRGIPEFPAMLAYESARPRPLTVDPRSVDFGCLKFGEGASATLHASGEPIVEVVAGSRLKTTLLKSGPTKTLVKLQLNGGSSGESFKEEIILRGNTGEMRVTVTACWEEERPRLSYCPICNISKKSLFWNYVDKKYECLNLGCKATGADLDKLLSP